MKKLILLFVAITVISIFFHSCRKDKLLKTTFSGRAYDVTRNKPVQGYEIVVSRVWDCSSGGLFSQRTCYETAGSVLTDVNGNFSMEFDALPGGEYYYLQRYQPPYREDVISSSGTIKPGAKNTLDIDVWYPVILKATVNVTNSIYPPLTINTYAGKTSLWNENIYGGPTITKTVYLKAKPNTINTVVFSYVTSPQANFSHKKPDSVFVNLQDTVAINYNIDCSTF